MSMRRALPAVCLALAGCSSVFGLDGPTLVSDAASDMADGTSELCYGSVPRVCLTSAPVGLIAIDGPLDTTTDTRCEHRTQAGGPDVCVISAVGVTLGQGTPVLVTGSRALVVIGRDQVEVVGVIDASSVRGGRLGAAGNDASCPEVDGMAGPSGTGGAGGSLGSRGGDGGASSLGNSGAVAVPTAITSVLRGGCPGGRGGDGNLGSGGGAGGSGGGAVALVSTGRIEVEATGAVFASGSGGGAGNATGGTGGAGGGGGAGGMVVLDAPSVLVAGTVAANGGGGGGGGLGVAGFPGDDGSTSLYTQAAAGGLAEGTSIGGAGGTGAAGTSDATPGKLGMSNGGGGGGGGGHGFVLVLGTLAGAQFSPAPTRP